MAVQDAPSDSTAAGGLGIYRKTSSQFPLRCRILDNTVMPVLSLAFLLQHLG
jgi:hypothetical protein